MPVRIAAVAAALSLLGAPAALADTTTPTLSVNGSGAVMVMPDVASLSVNVTRSAPSSRAALSAANRLTDAIVIAVRAAGVPTSGIQTSSIDVSPGSVKIGRRRHQHRVKRYIATESLSITTTVALAGQVIDLSVRAGASSVNGPNYSFADPSAGMMAATNAALADARRRADAAAATLGYKIIGVQSVNLDPQSSAVLPVAASSAPPAAKTPAPTTLHAGAQEVDANVTVVFTIAPV